VAIHDKLIGRALGGLCLTALLLTAVPSMAQDFASQPPRPRPGKMLSDARDLYLQGDYDRAAQIYQQLVPLKTSLSVNERTDLDRGIQLTVTAQQGRQQGGVLLDQAEGALRVGKTDEAAQFLRLAQANQFLSPTDKQRLQTASQGISKARSEEGRTDASTLLARARDALRRGDLDAAESLARQAEKARTFVANLMPWADSPSRVLEDVRNQRARMPKTTPFNPYAMDGQRPGPKDFPPLMTPDMGDPMKNIANASPAPGVERAQAKAMAKQIVMDGYKALEANDLEHAKLLAKQAKDLRVDLEWWEPNPDKLFADISRRAAVNEVVITGNDPVAVLRQGRSYYLQKRYDEAEKLAQQAENLSGKWGLLGDSPKKLRDDVAAGRRQLDDERAAKLLAESRRQLQMNNYADAKNLANQAKQLAGKQPLFQNPWADSPDAVLRDLARLERLNPQPNGPGDVAQAGMNDSLESAQEKMRAKARAVEYVVEARSLESQQLLVEARAKALEAQKTFAVWSPIEDSPAAVLRDLDTKAANRVKFLMNQATETVANNPADTTRFQKADTFLGIARRLAEAFRQDTAPIDQKIQWLQMAAGQSRNNTVAMAPLQSAKSLKDGSFDEASEPLPQLPEATPLPALPPALPPAAKFNHQDGLKKLDQARLELTAGNLPLARKLAEDAFAVVSVQQEAQKVLRSIDAEEDAQNIVAARRNFQAGMDAFKHHDYQKAARLLANIDVRHLEPDQTRQLGDVITSPEMRGGLKTAGFAQPTLDVPPIVPTVPTVPTAPPSIATAPPSIDTPPAIPGAPPVAVNPPPMAASAPLPPGQATAIDGDDPRLVQVRQMQKVQIEKYRDMSRTAQTRAIELAKAGQEEKAIEVLQEYQIKLKESGLEDGLTRSFSFAVSERIKGLRTTMAQKEIDRQRREQSGNIHNEADYQVKKSKIQEKVAELVNRGNQRYKEGKYDEAIAEASKAQELDSDNRAAKALIFVATTRKAEENAKSARQRTEEYVLDQISMDPGNMPTGNNPVRVNKDMLAYATANRKTGTTVMDLKKFSTRELLIERKLSHPISLNFQDLPLYRVIQDLEVMSGLNISIDRKALKDEGVSLEQQLSLQVNEISLKSALNLLLKQVNLTYVIKDEVLYITTPGEASGKRRVVTYSIADLVIPVDDHATTDVNSFEQAMKRVIASNTGGARYANTVPFMGQNSLQGGMPVSQSQGAPNGGGNWNGGRSSKGNTIEPMLIGLITNVIAPNTWEQTGGEGRIQYFELGHALVVSQVQEVQEEVFELLKALRRLQDIQVAIEMRIVSVSEKFFERIGLDFDVNIRTPQYRVENQLANGIFGGPFNINRNLNVGSGGSPVVTGLTPAGQLTPDLNIPIRATSNEFSIPPFGGFPGTLAGDGGLALGLAFLSDIQVFMFLEAAQGDQRTHIMQAPKLTVFNGQTANISVQDQMFFVTGVQIAQAGSQTFFVPQNNPFPVGVGMQVTPVVDASRRFVRMNLVPQITNLVSSNIPLIPVQIPIQQLFDAPNGQGFISGQPVIFQMFFQQPSFTQINLQTTVNVPDGGTVLLGGLKTMAEGRNEFGPPVLSKIPYINRLFRNQAFGREAQSIMIMVTPRIIINEEIEGEILGTQQVIPR
jgi:type II secretory pathway component GspD/PulD (secretin)